MIHAGMAIASSRVTVTSIVGFSPSPRPKCSEVIDSGVCSGHPREFIRVGLMKAGRGCSIVYKNIDCSVYNYLPSGQARPLQCALPKVRPYSVRNSCRASQNSISESRRPTSCTLMCLPKQICMYRSARDLRCSSGEFVACAADLEEFMRGEHGVFKHRLEKQSKRAPYPHTDSFSCNLVVVHMLGTVHGPAHVSFLISHSDSLPTRTFRHTESHVCTHIIDRHRTPSPASFKTPIS
jgi:hypothetical protein